MSLIATGLLANHKYYADLKVLKVLADSAESLPIRELIERFAAYNGYLFPEVTGVIVKAIQEACRRDSLGDAATAVDRSGQVHADLLARLGLGHVSYFAAGPTQPEATWPLLGACPNAHQSEELPRPISRRLAFASCPAFDFHAAAGATLYVAPCDFQLFNAVRGYYVPGATARPHTTSILSAPVLNINRPVVLIQDIFNGYNFAHFLLDWVTRLAIFAAHGPFPAPDCLFVFGGIPGEFQRIVLDAARAALGLDGENFFFPTTDVLIRSSTHIGYFSDQCSDIGHPAQMCRPETMAWIERLAHAIEGRAVAGHRNLYISRGDVGRRAIVNEAELFGRLEARGFEFVRLGDLPVADQLSLMRSADTVVAAHGMGLTYLALHTGKVKVIELHNPGEGTDTYAFVSKGKGFEYRSVIGEGIAGTSNFRVDVGQLERVLHHAPGPLPPIPLAQSVTMDLRSQTWHPGCQSPLAATTTEIPPPLPSDAVIKHVRNAASQVSDTNVGWWQLEMLRPLQTYMLSCMVYIPASFRGEGVVLSAGEPRGRTVAADLSRRDAWQHLSMTLMLAHDISRFNLVLRVNSAVETLLYSSAWRVDQTPYPRPHDNPDADHAMHVTGAPITTSHGALTSGHQPDAAVDVAAPAIDVEDGATKRNGSPMARPRYILHIGLPKTGTKYLQSGFWHLRQKLQQQGVYYPSEWWETDSIFAHHELARDLRQVPDTRIADIFSHLNASACDIVLLSCEDFLSVPVSGLGYLRDLMQGAQVDIVFYARRWSDWLPSQWQQSVKQGSLQTFPEWYAFGLANANRYPGINQAMFLNGFAKVFGRDSINLVSYSNLMDHKVDIFRHFWSNVLQLATPCEFNGDGVIVHPSMDIFVTELIRCINSWEVMRSNAAGYHLFQAYEELRAAPAVADNINLVVAAMKQNIAEIVLDDNADNLQPSYDRMNDYRDRLVSPEYGNDVFERRTRKYRYVQAEYLMADDILEAVGRICDTLRQRVSEKGAPRAA